MQILSGPLLSVQHASEAKKKRFRVSKNIFFLSPRDLHVVRPGDLEPPLAVAVHVAAGAHVVEPGEVGVGVDEARGLAGLQQPDVVDLHQEGLVLKGKVLVKANKYKRLRRTKK